MNETARRSDRRVRGVTALLRCLVGAAPIIALLLAVASSDAAFASPFRRLVPSTVAFVSDGTRYAAWQVAKDSPLVVLDTWRGEKQSYAGCAIEGEEGHAAGLVAAAGRFLVRCGAETGTVLLDAATGAKTKLPEPDSGEWRAIGSRYVEGNADRRVCKHSTSEEKREALGEGPEGELTCIALYEIATGTLSYRPGSQIAELDRPGAPVVCSAFRTRLLANGGRFDTNPAGFGFGEGALAESVNHGEAPVKRIRIRHCRGRSRLISTAPGPRDLFPAGGLLTWDTGHAGADFNAGEEGEDTSHGKLWSYQTATGRRRSLPLPRTTIIGSRKVQGVFGYSSHAGKTLFWIAARTLYSNKVVGVETSSVYAAPLR